MLPLGQRVQEKLEKLIEKHMLQVGASKVSLSSLSSQALWEKTNRLEGYGPELFRLNDRKETPLLLAPTHEEEITTLVSCLVSSSKDLPLRLYQIGRKYRDEIRPRHGLLRSREFLMKDLYTFDATVESALQAYEEVRAAYSQLFDELKLPYLVAEASSGDIGGDLSHEYHLPSAVGEDIVISCDTCAYVANEELAVAKPRHQDESQQLVEQCWHGITKDRSTLVKVLYRAPSGNTTSSINTHALKSIVPGLDSSVIDAQALWDATTANTDTTKHKTLTIIDHSFVGSRETGSDGTVDVITTSEDGQPLNLLSIQDGDGCANCSSGKLKLQKAVELGHTFHLGTRYSMPLGAAVPSSENKIIPIQMGCHGIGVSRIIGAVAHHLADKKGLNWPRAIAPYEVVIIPGRSVQENDANTIYDQLVQQEVPGQSQTLQALDVVLDDRPLTFPWKMKDADTVGYPVVVLMGRRWASEKLCEVQCRRLSVKEDVSFEDLSVYINKLLSQL
jgi:prolyl-tRNA synthetase